MERAGQPHAASTEDGIVEKLLDGYSLRTVMVPDPEIGTGSNFPEHLEGINLPHIVINGRAFWAKSETCHLAHTLGDESTALVSWAYTNLGDYFCSHEPDAQQARIMRKSRYKSHCWKLVQDYKLVWDSLGEHANSVIKEEIERGAKFRIAMLDEEDIWNIHPVNLPFYYSHDDRFRLETHYDRYPGYFRCPELFAAHADQLFAQVMENQFKNWFAGVEEKEARKLTTGMSLPVSIEEFCSFYALNSDGTYHNFFDLPKSRTQKFKSLLVFTEIIDG